MAKRGGREARQALRRLPWAWLAVGAVALALVGVGLAAALGGRGGGQVGEEVSPGGVPDFTLRAASWAGGREFVLSQNLGRPIVLYFMAGWCQTCIPETQALSRIKDEAGDRVHILVISSDPTETDQRMLRFKEVAGASDALFWAIDRGARLAQALGVVTLDTTIVLDAQGREVYRATGCPPLTAS